MGAVLSYLPLPFHRSHGAQTPTRMVIVQRVCFWACRLRVTAHMLTPGFPFADKWNFFASAMPCGSLLPYR